MTTASGGSLITINEQDCLALLASQQIGRLGVIAGNYPLIFCVNYGLDGDVVVIRTHAGTKFDHANHANVTFEVDFIDAATHSGWSVLVRGLAEEVTGAHSARLVAQTQAVGIQPWAPGPHDRWLRVIPHRVTGRLIPPGHLRAAFPDAAYL